MFSVLVLGKVDPVIYYFYIWRLDDTVFLLNLYVQSMGYYVQWFIQTGSHTDAFAQLGPSHGAEDRDRFVYEDFESSDGPSSWMNGWTIFYWGWWVSWSPFVGMFIAKISQGRTVKVNICFKLIIKYIYVYLYIRTSLLVP